MSNALNKTLNNSNPVALGKKLGLNEDLLVACVSCGLCLPHCPTYRATGEELLSPRGRIAVMRAIEHDGLEVDETVRHSLDSCVMCRGCETACPSAVQFGSLMETTRATISSTVARPPVWLRAALGLLPRHRLLVGGSRLLALFQRARLIPPSISKRASLPARLPLRSPQLRGLVAATHADAILYTGCVMDAWQRQIHADGLALMRATGAQVAVPSLGGSCCGALHSHSGLVDSAKRLAQHVIDSCPGTAAIVVDSAGCGAALQDYGHLLGTPQAEAFSKRVVDISTWLSHRIDLLPNAARSARPEAATREAVVVQDPCHLRHVQRSHLPVRTLLSLVVDIIELPDDGRCCGAGGAYSVLQPELATTIRDAKVAVIRNATTVRPSTVVASGNPGCSMWLERGGLITEHPVSIVARHGRQAGWLHE